MLDKMSHDVKQPDICKGRIFNKTRKSGSTVIMISRDIEVPVIDEGKVSRWACFTEDSKKRDLRTRWGEQFWHLCHGKVYSHLQKWKFLFLVCRVPNPTNDPLQSTEQVAQINSQSWVTIRRFYADGSCCSYYWCRHQNARHRIFQTTHGHCGRQGDQAKGKNDIRNSFTTEHLPITFPDCRVLRWV